MAGGDIWMNLKTMMVVLTHMMVMIFVIVFNLFAFLNLPTTWPWFLPYLCWIYWDRDTPHKDGRRWESLRAWQGLSLARSYFPQQLVKTADLPPTTNYVLCLFPHGVLTSSVFCHFFSSTSDIPKLFPDLRITPLTLTLNFWWPFLRELFLGYGACSVREDSMMHQLSGPGGKAVLLVPGGVAEAFLTHKGEYNLVLKERKGFIRVAHQAGASVVPVMAFRECEVFRQVKLTEGSWAYKLQDWLKRQLTLAPCLVYGRFGILPYKVPVTTVVGAPIALEKVEKPSKELVNASHAKFVAALEDLFETHKHAYLPDPENVHLNIV